MDAALAMVWDQVGEQENPAAKQRDLRLPAIALETEEVNGAHAGRLERPVQGIGMPGSSRAELVSLSVHLAVCERPLTPMSGRPLVA